MSGRENDYSKIVSRNSDEELMQLLSDHEKYIDGLLEAAVWEMQKRNLSHPLMEQIEKNIVHEEETETQSIEGDEIIQDDTETVVLPPLYSQTAIMGFTLFLSPIFGGIMLAMNAWKTYKKGVIPIILFSVIYTVVLEYTALKIKTFEIQQQRMVNISLAVIGALIMSTVLWNKYIGRKVSYEKRSIRIPFFIAIMIFTVLAYIVYMHPELIPISEKI